MKIGPSSLPRWSFVKLKRFPLKNCGLDSETHHPCQCPYRVRRSPRHPLVIMFRQAVSKQTSRGWQYHHRLIRFVLGGFLSMAGISRETETGGVLLSRKEKREKKYITLWTGPEEAITLVFIIVFEAWNERRQEDVLTSWIKTQDF